MPDITLAEGKDCLKTWGKWACYVRQRDIPGDYVPWKDPEGRPFIKAIKNALLKKNIPLKG